MVAPEEAVGDGVWATADFGRMGTTFGGADEADGVSSSSSDSEASPGTIMSFDLGTWDWDRGCVSLFHFTSTISST